MPNTPLKELYNLYRYIQHLILEFKFDYNDDEFDNPLDEGNWLLQTRGKHMKFVIPTDEFYNINTNHLAHLCLLDINFNPDY